MSGLKFYQKQLVSMTWYGLIPFGMSGLKSVAEPALRSLALSHPVWDEWIEILKLS